MSHLLYNHVQHTFFLPIISAIPMYVKNKFKIFFYSALNFQDIQDVSTGR